MNYFSAFFVFLGLMVLCITYWDYSKNETDTLFILDIWGWFNISKDSMPILFWLILTVQAVSGFWLIYYGFTG